MTRRLSGERLRRRSESERAGDHGTQRLPLLLVLLQVLHLLRDCVDQLLDLLELRELLLLEELYLLKLLRHDLQHLDEVEIPRYATLDAQRRRIPRRLMGALMVLAVLVGLGLIGLLAELAHRAQLGGR